MKSSESIKIAIAESSPIVRAGLVAVVKRCLDATVVTQEIASPSDFVTRVRSFAPDVVILNPLFDSSIDIVALRAKADVNLLNVKMVAVTSQLVPSPLLADFDFVFNILDDECEVRRVLSLAVGLDDSDPEEVEEQLSAREKQVVKGVVMGLANKEIAEAMNISVYTVLTHRRNISRKLQIHSATALAIYAISNKIVAVDDVK